MVEPNTSGRPVNPARWCESCDESIPAGREAPHHDGDLLCPACWAERRAEDAREAMEEAEAEIEAATIDMDARRVEYDFAVKELEEEFDRDLAEMRSRLKTWQRRADRAKRALTELGSIAAAVGAPAPVEAPAPAPIAGGGPDGPTEADWADYREWAEEYERRLRDKEIDERAGEGGPDLRYGYE